jgi:polar amino acid transport system substrate-binding protein
VLRQQFAGIVMRPGRDDLLKNVNESVARNTANGELNKLYRKWLGVDLPKLQ